MQLSIAMATFNGARYLPEQLESFVRQEARPHELVVCDDGSTDATLEILEDFGRGAPFAVHVQRHEKRLGYAGNFERALGLCRGDLVFLSDQDDVWYPEKLRIIRSIALERPSFQVFMNDAMLTGEHLLPSPRTKLEQLRWAGIGHSSFVQGCCAAVRGSFLRFALPLPAACEAHDGWIVELARLLGAKLVHPRALQDYRIHSTNTSGYFVNRAGSVPLWRKVRTRLSVPRGELDAELRREMHHLVALRERLDSGQHTRAGLEDEVVERALAIVSERMNATGSRLALLARGRARRFLDALRLLRRGGYAHFNGIQSLVRDILS